MSEKPDIQNTDTPVPIQPSPVPITEDNQFPLPHSLTKPPPESSTETPFRNAQDIIKQLEEGKEKVGDITDMVGDMSSGTSPLAAIGAFWISNKIKQFLPSFDPWDLQKYLIDRKSIKSLPDLDLEQMDPLERHLRFVFLRKVFAVFSAQVALTFGIISLSFSTTIKLFLLLHLYLIFVFGGILLIAFITLAVYRYTALGCPGNYIVLGLFTIGESFFLLLLSIGFTQSTVLTIMGMLCMLSFALAIFSLINSKGFNYCGAYWFSFLFVAVYYVICGFGFNDWKITSICLGCIVLFAIYFVFDTVNLINNLRMFYSPDDFIYVAAYMYLDFIKVFYDTFKCIGRFIFAC